MHGSFATVGAVNLAEACNQCEMALLREPLNPASVEANQVLLERLRKVVARLVDGALYPQGQ